MKGLDIKGDKDFADFHTFVTCALIMYKIIVFGVFLFYLANSEYTEDCPSEYFDGEDDYCYHIGIGRPITQDEAMKYCESKNGKLFDPSKGAGITRVVDLPQNYPEIKPCVF